MTTIIPDAMYLLRSARPLRGIKGRTGPIRTRLYKVYGTCGDAAKDMERFLADMRQFGHVIVSCEIR